MAPFAQTLQWATHSLVTGAAPSGSRRRRFLKASKRAVGRLFQRGHPTSVEPPRFNVYDADSFRAFLKHCRAPLLKWSIRGAGRSELQAARLAMGLLQSDAALRKRFAKAISAGERGAYCNWLCTEGAAKLGISQAAINNVCAAFARRLGARVQQLFDYDGELARILPLALTPCQRHLFACHLLMSSKRDVGLCDEEIWWYLFGASEDSSQGLVATYLRTPDWQQRFPQALTASGRREFLAWAEGQCGLESGSTDEAAVPISESAAARRGVNVMGHFCYPSGLGEALHAVVRGLNRVGIGTSCRDIPASFHNDRPAHADYLGLEEFDYTVVLMAPEPDLSRCFHAARLHPRAGVQRIAVWYWELENVPPELSRPSANTVQEIWAPTQFIAGAMRKAFTQPVTTMLPGVELGDVRTLSRRQFGVPDDRFLFLFMFDMCSTMARKNPLGLIRAYQQAFRPDDRVALAIKVSRGESDVEGMRCLRQAAREAGVVLIDSVLSRADAYGLLKCADCYTSLHRSEGFGLTMAESMLLGKPVLGTGYSGNVDFMTPANSLLIEYERVPITENVSFYAKGNVWAEPSAAHAAECMRWVFDHQEDAGALGLRAQTEMRSLLSFDAAGKRMAQRLLELQTERKQQAGRAA